MRSAAAFASLLALGLAAPVGGQGDDVLHTVLPRDAIPAIDEPSFEPVVTAKLNDREPVLGIVGEREQRAYSTWQLDRHEIVNDVFEGKPIAVTWCPLCGTGIVYARTVGSRTLTFGVSGMLYRDALVMYDRETGTFWSQVDGRALKGELLGRTLQVMPAMHATWREWKTLYPESLVLRKQGERESSYDDYNRDPSTIGIFGRRLKDSLLPPKERILGVRYGDSATAFVLKDVRQEGVVLAQVGNVPVVVASLAPNLPVVVFERRIGSRVLTFERTPSVTELEDMETHSRWRITDGLAVDGPLKGERLARATALPAFWFGWQGFFPRSTVWKR
jgi:hypothetical protein